MAAKCERKVNKEGSAKLSTTPRRNYPIEGFGTVFAQPLSKLGDLVPRRRPRFGPLLCRNSGLLTAIKLPSMHPNIPTLRTMEPPGPLIYIVDSVRSSWIAFSCVVSSSDYESAALPLSYLGKPLKRKMISVYVFPPEPHFALFLR